MFGHEVILAGKFDLSLIYNCNNLPKIKILRLYINIGLWVHVNIL